MLDSPLIRITAAFFSFGILALGINFEGKLTRPRFSEEETRIQGETAGSRTKADLSTLGDNMIYFNGELLTLEELRLVALELQDQLVLVEGGLRDIDGTLIDEVEAAPAGQAPPRQRAVQTETEEEITEPEETSQPPFPLANNSSNEVEEPQDEEIEEEPLEEPQAEEWFEEDNHQEEEQEEEDDDDDDGGGGGGQSSSEEDEEPWDGGEEEEEESEGDGEEEESGGEEEEEPSEGDGEGVGEGDGEEEEEPSGGDGEEEESGGGEEEEPPVD